jgi:arginyl-tRNA synthetase
LRRASALGIETPVELTAREWAKLTHPDELWIAARLGEYPGVVAEAAAKREPHRIAFYVSEHATSFQSYFTRLKSENDPILPQESQRAAAGWEKSWDFGKTAARLAWIRAIRVVYASGLSLLGVSAPERMDRPALGEQSDKGEQAAEAEEAG